MAGKNDPSVGGREVVVAGMFLPLLTPCPLLVEAACHGLGTTDSVPYFPSLWLKQRTGSHLQLRRHVQPFSLAGVGWSWHPAGPVPCGSFLKGGDVHSCEIWCFGVRRPASLLCKAGCSFASLAAFTPFSTQLSYSILPIIKPEG